MSGRPVGASNRADLFSSREQVDKPADGEFSPNAKQREISEAYGMDGPNNDDPLQLEHILGYAGDFRNTIICLPGNENLYIKSMGSLASIENLNDPQKQLILRGHDMQLTAMAISPSGKYLATGQFGTKNFKGCAAPVFIWDIETTRRLLVLRGLTSRVNLISFSTDERFVCGCGEDSLLYIWDLATGEVVYGQRLVSVVAVMKWIEHKTENRRVVYELILGIGSNLNKGIFSYDPVRVQWTMRMQAFTMPPGGGIVRYFNCMDISYDKIFVFVGTTGGDVLIFRRDSCVFRACIPICTNGVKGVVALPFDQMLCAGGDGLLKKLTGTDMAWSLDQQIKIDEGGLTCLSLSSNESEVIIGCTSGTVLRCMLEDLKYTSVSLSHTKEITCIAFGEKSPTIFATGSSYGDIKIWDITDYACLTTIKDTKSGSVTSLVMTPDGSIISGWSKGLIRCYDGTLNRQLWFIPEAHRGGTTTLALYSDPNNKLSFLASGGIDGTVRIWRLGNRELITQYTEHTKPVCKILVDTNKPNILHSVGADGTVLSYDLKTVRRIICHIVNGGSMLDMTQRRDSETELITSDAIGRLTHWDIDVREPVMLIHDPTRLAIRKCSISPTGRFLAFGGDDTVLKVLDVTTGQVLSLGQGHSSSIKALSWTPDERQIVTGGDDCCLVIWNFYLGG